jgi:predicted secreted protein
MTLADQAVLSGHDGQVTEGQPARPKRRTFTAAYKARILEAFDALPDGSWFGVQARRAATFRAACEAHPERFRSRCPQPKSLPAKVWINEPPATIETTQSPQTTQAA